MKDLIESLNELIDQEGGRLKLAETIMSECREFFTYKERLKIDQLIVKDEKTAYKLKIKIPNPYMWTHEDIQFLMENRPNMSLAKLSMKLGRTKSGVRQKYNKLYNQSKLFKAA